MPQNLSKEEIEDLSRRDILSYGIFHIDLLQNRKWEVSSRAWMPEIYQVVNPREIELSPQGKAKTLSIQKSTQCGMTTMGLIRLLHFADFWAIRAMYMLPRQQDYIDFVTTRVDPTIKKSERLLKILGDPDSTRAKQLGNSYLFFMESTVEPRMMPADAIFVDEIDLSNMTHVSTLDNRMDASLWKLKFYFSTPTLPNYGINGLYSQSDRRQWFVKCPKCGAWQTMDWDAQLRVVGSRMDPSNVYFGCIKCDLPLTLEIIQTGTWIPEYPERSSKHIGFHISQMMTHSAEELYARFIDPKTKLYEFYRKSLGKPYELGIGSLEREDVLSSCFDEPYEYEAEPSPKARYYMGVDQGNELQVLVAKVDKGTDRPKIIHMELVPYDDGGFERISKLMYLYGIKICVLDADPNRHSARDLQSKFPGRLLYADYSESKVDWQTKKDPKTGVKASVVIGRSEGFDSLVESIKDREWQLPGFVGSLHPDTELIIDHVTALKRDVEERNTPSGTKEAAVWRELRPAHLAHAWLYLKTAIEVDQGKSFRSSIIGADKAKSGADPATMAGFLKDNIIRITAQLAECPLDQLQEYLDTGEYTKFPIRYKMKLVLESGYSKAEIRYAAKGLVADKRIALDF